MLCNPFLTSSSTSCIIRSFGIDLNISRSGEQNWHPLPQPLVISTIPLEDGFFNKGILSDFIGCPLVFSGSFSPFTACSNNGPTIPSASPSTRQSIHHSANLSGCSSNCHIPGPPIINLEPYFFNNGLCIRSSNDTAVYEGAGHQLISRNMHATICETAA